MTFIPRPRRSTLWALCAAAAVLLAAASGARARNPEEPEAAPRPGNDLSFLDHGGAGPLWLGGDLNVISQAHPSFPARRSGAHSLRSGAESATSELATVFVAYSVSPLTELILDPEVALGGGLSGAVGAAGFSNLDVVRNPTLSHAPYVARAELHQIIPLSDEWVDNEDRGPISSMARLPRHRLEVRLGKMSTADLFDINPAGSDSHLQFMNWSVDNNGAFDYAADTRGYTYAFVVEYQGPRVEVRFGEMLMPKEANGLDLDWDLTRNRGENLEVELKYGVRAGWHGTLRLLAYQNHANMGSYRQAIDAFNGHLDATPDVTRHRQQGRVKRGVGANLVQELGGVARLFARLGASGGDLESYAYTEIENTVEVGADVTGARWRRPGDRTGLALVSNGISALHREYLRLGGLGFLLGDGDLRYGRELVVEHYYNVHVWRGLFVAEDIQRIANPGYNADRGPAWIFSLRGHLEF